MGFLSSFGNKNKQKKSNNKVLDTSNKATLSNPERGGLGKFVDGDRIEKPKPIEPQSSKDFFSNSNTKFEDPELTIRPPSAPLFAPIQKKEQEEAPKSTILPKDLTASNITQNATPVNKSPLFTEKETPSTSLFAPVEKKPEIPSTMLLQNNTNNNEDDYEPVFLFGGAAPKPISREQQNKPQQLKDAFSGEQREESQFTQQTNRRQDPFPTKAEKSNTPQTNSDISNVMDFLSNNPSSMAKQDVSSAPQIKPETPKTNQSFNNNQTPKINIFQTMESDDTEDNQPVSLFFKESTKAEVSEVPEDLDSIINRKLEEIRVLSEKYK